MKYALRLFTLLSCIGTMSLADNEATNASSGKLLTLDQAIGHYDNQRLFHGESPDRWVVKKNDDLHYDAFHLLPDEVTLKIKRDPSMVTHVNELGDTPLHILARVHPMTPYSCYCTRYNHHHLNIQDRLFLYVEYAELVRNTCRALVSAGVDLTKKNIYGLTALETAQLHKGFDNNMNDSIVIDFLSRAEKWSKYPLIQKALMKIGWL